MHFDGKKAFTLKNLDFTILHIRSTWFSVKNVETCPFHNKFNTFLCFIIFFSVIHNNKSIQKYI